MTQESSSSHEARVHERRVMSESTNYSTAAHPPSPVAATAAHEKLNATTAMPRRSPSTTNNHHHCDAPPTAISVHRSGSGSTISNNSQNSLDRGEDRGVQRHAYSIQQVRQAMSTPAPAEQEDNDGQSNGGGGGILASGLAWVQRKREQRRKEDLQHQAELQLRKIYDAERKKLGGGSSSGGGGDVETSEEQFAKAGSNYDLSKSGEGASGKLDMTSFDEEGEDYIPEVRVKEEKGGTTTTRPFILSKEQMQQIAIHVLPQTVAFGRWKRLYDIGRDGDSFDACLRIIQNTARTLMVVRTTKGDVFGGYAESAWNTNKSGSVNFYGGASACLFSVIPGTDRLKVYKWTGKNRYIQLCDVTHKMFAFGGGGDDSAFGLAIEEDFQRGSSGPCDTFDNDPLCDQGSFQIVDLEFWEFLTGVF